jgi:prepilin-type N-terminal cleavage/methylation domain-containing protein
MTEVRGPRRGVRGHRGFTLIELLVAIVISGVILTAIYQVLLVQQQIFTEQRERVRVHQTVRAGLAVMSAEIRELSPEDGDLLQLGAQQMGFQAVRGLGFACDKFSDSPLSLRVVISGRMPVAGDRVYLYVEGDLLDISSDYWVTADVSSVSAADGACPYPADVPEADRPRGRVLTLSPTETIAPSQVRLGAMLRIQERYTYGLMTFEGDPYLARTEGVSATVVPLVGPVRGGDGVAFRFLNGAGAETATASEVRAIEVTLRAVSGARDRQGVPIGDSLTALVHSRN